MEEKKWTEVFRSGQKRSEAVGSDQKRSKMVRNGEKLRNAATGRDLERVLNEVSRFYVRCPGDSHPREEPVAACGAGNRGQPSGRDPKRH